MTVGKASALRAPVVAMDAIALAIYRCIIVLMPLR